VLGPTLYISAPAMSGQTVKDPETGRRLVREAKQAGFDALKVHEGLSLETYDAIASTAKELGLPFGGHVADQVGLLHSLKAGQASIEHLDGYVEALEADDSPIKNADAATRNQQLIKYVDERKIRQCLEVRAGVLVRGRWLPESEIQSMLDKFASGQT
jgi:hypothetical protein